MLLQVENQTHYLYILLLLTIGKPNTLYVCIDAHMTGKPNTSVYVGALTSGKPKTLKWHENQ